MQLSGNTIVITGGGSGIGRALAHRLHDLGNQIIVAGRRETALNETAAGRKGIRTLTLDADDPASIAAFAARVTAEHPAANVLINNAGIMRYEDAGRGRDLADAEATVVSNLLGPIRLTDALVDHLSAQPNAAVINVTSGLAFVPWKKTPTYSATKAGLHAYTVALREQLKGRVEVIELAPPAVQTELTPGQSTRASYQPLDAFADEVIGLLRTDPDASEILVKNVHPLRFAERDGQMPAMLQMLANL
uniref:SDR family oxidoreductase n=1 Tax=uncultured Sphingomonas sp. TaxID=158754 RepID=UPI0025D8B6D0|nr:SDR family oxidoreductase [uncultured Sphingomonas sp.]